MVSRGKTNKTGIDEALVKALGNLLIDNSIENTWFNNSNKNQSYITINEEQLDQILKGQEVSSRPKQGIVDLENRF